MKHIGKIVVGKETLKKLSTEFFFNLIVSNSKSH